MDALNKKIAIGAGWAVFTKFLVKSLGLISTVILARLLAPEDFGVIAMCMIVVAFLEVFTSFGFDLNIIQKDNVTNKTLNSAWTLKLIMGLILSTVLVSVSGLVATYYNDQRVEELVLAVALLPFITAVQNIGFVLYRKELDLAKEFPLEVYSKLFSFVITIGFTFYLENYWALVIGMYANAIAKTFMSFLMHPYRPKLELSEAKELFKFSKWLLLNNLLIFFNHKVTDIIVGKQSSAEQLGYYTVGYEISNLPTTELLFPLSRSIFPGYAKLKNDIEKLRVTFLKITEIIIFVSAPVSVGISICSPEIVQLGLGDQWQPIIPIIAILSLYGFSRCAVQNIGTVFVVIGKPNIPSLISLVRIIFIIPLLLYFVERSGALGASLVILFVSLITMPLSFLIVSRYLSISLIKCAKVFVFPVFTSLLMYISIELLLPYLQVVSLGSNLLMLLLKAIIGIVIYSFFTLIYLRLFPESDLSQFVRLNLISIRNKIKVKLLKAS
ncbi:lipopolysaccharide biosynthesis protein [Colwellia sp. D2M02]|uniref:lipopolysaccharide biosynthesis protein n=1 Tax=Colwellia sp. D2M02 TaxID=2841562 RepID=UPI001C09F062|nr:lipopolysaccharide biosynthesis protein [Colwellia sp. D2M02]MBU2894681.1 lipopolysaccharide biosynthesis protein [Colwellia sp. D2M02]